MAVKVSEYGTPTTPSGRSVVVMAIGAARIVSEHPAVLVALALSVTWSVNARSTAASRSRDLTGRRVEAQSGG